MVGKPLRAGYTEAVPTATIPPTNRPRLPRWWVTAFILVLAGGIAAGGYIYVHQPGDITNIKEVEARVARHLILPTDETPALATVTDTSKLANNKFLGQGKNGDKILIYAKWRRAVLYRPSTDRIVDVGPVDVALPAGDTKAFRPLTQ